MCHYCVLFTRTHTHTHAHAHAHAHTPLSLSTFQELSKIAMPVMFNEPLSFLQRLAEYMEHTYLLQQANTSTDSVERMKV